MSKKGPVLKRHLNWTGSAFPLLIKFAAQNPRLGPRLARQKIPPRKVHVGPFLAIFPRKWGRFRIAIGLACYRGGEPTYPKSARGGAWGECRPGSGVQGKVLQRVLGKMLGRVLGKVLVLLFEHKTISASKMQTDTRQNWNWGGVILYNSIQRLQIGGRQSLFGGCNCLGVLYRKGGIRIAAINSR